MNLDRFSQPLEMYLQNDLAFVDVEVEALEDSMCEGCGENEAEHAEDLCLSCIQIEEAGMSQQQVDAVLKKSQKEKIRCS